MRFVGDVADVIAGQHVLARDVNDASEGTPYLTGPSDFVGDVPVATAWTRKGLKFCERGDILITVKGSGCGTLARADQRFAISRQLMAIRSRAVDQDYLWCALRQTVKSLFRHAAGTIPGLTRDQVLNLEVPELGDEVERSVADAAGYMERLANVLDGMHRAKSSLKRGLMQRLLNGQKRFPEFGARPFALQPFCELCEELGERNGKRYGPERVMGVIKGVGFERMRDRVRGKGELSRYKVVPPGAFAYNPMRLNIGSIAYNTIGQALLVSPDYEVFRIREGRADPDFVNQLRFSWYWSSFMERAGAGSVRVRIYFSDLARLRVPMPLVDEQKRISWLLKLMDAELDLLTAERRQVELYKRGLLSRLLSGEITVPA